MATLPVRSSSLSFGAAENAPQISIRGSCITNLQLGRSSFWRPLICGSSRILCLTSADPKVAKEDENTIPLPIVHIDQDRDPHMTVVELSFGDRLGGLFDTMKSLKDLGLNVVKGTVTGSSAVNRLYITRADNGRKVDDPELLESIRLTIIANLLKYHPESSENLALGEAFGPNPPKKKLDVDVATRIRVYNAGPHRSLLSIETADKPGLLLEIVEMIVATSVTVESAEIDTEGLVAKDKFYVSYGGAALSKSLAQVLVNCLRFHLRRSESEDESY